MTKNKFQNLRKSKRLEKNDIPEGRRREKTISTIVLPNICPNFFPTDLPKTPTDLTKIKGEKRERKK